VQRANQLNLLDDPIITAKENDWTFNGASTRELTHCYHDYPARMIPQVAAKLIDLYGGNAKNLFDPYCGSGTSLVEGMLRGLDVIGTDLNPLARIIAEAETTIPDLFALENSIKQYNDFVLRSQPIKLEKSPIIQGITNIDFWFKPQVIEKLLRLKVFIDTIDDDAVRLFFKVAFSETIRESSNTRNDEFKLYRYDPIKLKLFDPHVFYIMSSKLKRNRLGLEKYIKSMCKYKNFPDAKICGFNTVEGIPEKLFSKNSVDLVVTSPPYGDSHTTVAYGQYSRLSAAWLGLEEPEKIDRKLMGGQIIKKMPVFPSEELNKIINQIAQKDHKRAMEVASFYSELQQSISNVAKVIKPGGYACYVVGNRKVKGNVLPTDVTIRDFFSSVGYEYIVTHQRCIPNKRMPLRNSPTNATGVLDDTMTREYIVVMRRKLNYMVAERLSIYSPSSKKKNSKLKTISHGSKTVKTVLEKKKTIYKSIKSTKQK
jgi:tRNA G10  N-methylase Trm11